MIAECKTTFTSSSATMEGGVKAVNVGILRRRTIKSSDLVLFPMATGAHFGNCIVVAFATASITNHH
jgi:hypothetical protein